MNRYLGQRTLLFTEKGEKIQLTATTSREINYSAEVSENTVETGYVIADSVINKPITVQITQIISTTDANNHSNAVNSNVFSYWQAIYNRLIDSRVLMTVQTSDYIYKNMILTSFSVKRGNKSILTEITLNFKQVIIVSTSMINMPKNYEYLKDIVENGENGTKDATTNDANLPASSEQKGLLPEEETHEDKVEETLLLKIGKAVGGAVKGAWDFLAN